jgi:hypothetical protein
MARLAVRFAPHIPLTHYNAGVVDWWLQRETSSGVSAAWREHLGAFLELAQGDRSIPAAAIDTATAILQGRYFARPVLLSPDSPVLMGP